MTPVPDDKRASVAYRAIADVLRNRIRSGTISPGDRLPGIRAIGEETITSAMLGELQPNLGLRTEFLALARD